MMEEFAAHNLFLRDLDSFEKGDPHLAGLKGLPIVHPLDWWRDLDLGQPGVFILTGGRQIGKSTSTKLFIRHVLSRLGLPPKAVWYLPCDTVIDHVYLLHLLRNFLEGLPADSSPFLLVIDEVTFVSGWTRAVKALADEGWFRRGVCVITGSDTVVPKEAALSLPGRRGDAVTVDHHLLPVPFFEYADLAAPDLPGGGPARSERLRALFNNYLACGGYLRAINDLHLHGEVRPATYATFEQWIRGDFVRRGRSEATLIAVLQALMDVGVSQVSYTALTERVGTVSKETVMDYCDLLERIDLLLVLQAYDQNRHRGAPRKARKFHIADPFIRRTVRRWLEREGSRAVSEDEGVAVEACAAAHVRRLTPVYYFKATGEVDIIAPLGEAMNPLEVKWSGRVRPADVAQLGRLKGPTLLTGALEPGLVDGIPALPLPEFLYQCRSPGDLERLVSH